MLILPVALLGVIQASDLAAARCLSYGPAQVTLAGELTSRTVPGPPGYSSVARGDLPETILVLRLSAPICVSADTSSLTNSRSHAGLTEVQLVVEGLDYRTLLSKQVRVSGTLFAGQSGHHRTPVVLAVKSLRAA